MLTAARTRTPSLDLNRLETVVDSSGTTRYTYTAVGSRESLTYPNGTVAAYAYDDLNRLTDLVNKKADGEVIASYHYELGPTGNRLKVIEHDGSTVSYTYDNLYRLTGEVRTGTNPYSIGFTYDPVGNRKTQTKNGDATAYAYDDNDRLTTETGPDGVTTYEYDANGSTTRKLAPDGTTTYEYDLEKRLVGAITPTETISYAYDADGNRVSKTSAATTSEYLVDTNNNTGFAQVLEETDAAGAARAVYAYGDDLLSQSRAAGTSFYHYDGLGSTRALSDVEANKTDTYSYNAFGEIVAKMGDTPNDFLFTGEQYDPNIGFYYLRARYYNPAIGCFVTSDPFPGSPHDPASLHKYLYCKHDPVNRVDASGLFLTYLTFKYGNYLHAKLQARYASAVMATRMLMLLRIVAVVMDYILIVSKCIRCIDETEDYFEGLGMLATSELITEKHPSYKKVARAVAIIVGLSHFRLQPRRRSADRTLRQRGGPERRRPWTGGTRCGRRSCWRGAS